MTPATAVMLAGLALAYVLGALPVPEAVSLAVATLSIAVPVALREAGRIDDQDELQRDAQRRGGLWAFLLLLTMLPLAALLPAHRLEALAGSAFEAAIVVFALVYLAVTRGAAVGCRLVLWIAAGAALVYGLCNLPDLDKLAAMAVVAVGLAIVGFLAGRWPQTVAVLVAVVWIARLVSAGRGGADELVTLAPTTVAYATLVVLLARAADPEEVPS